MQTDERHAATVTGVVTETLPNAMFRVEIPAGDAPRLVLAYLAGKMRMYKIRVLVGDSVEMVLDQYGERARIVRRL